jgi:DNA polymerase III alpha subunit
MVNFPTPHCHIQSLDSASTPERFAQRELELGTGHVTVTDHGTLEATREVYDLCKNKKQYQGLSPILGLEGYFRDDDCSVLKAAGISKDSDGTFRSHIKYNHITLHALDERAYSAISRLLSQADLRAEKHGSERKPLFNWQHLEELGAHNVTATSGCLIGMVGRHLLKNSDPQVAVRYYEKLRSIFKPGNFYVEIFPHICDRNWESKVVITDTSGRTHDFYPYKKLKLDKGEMKAEELASLGVTKARALGSVRAIMNQRVWTEVPPIEIKEISRVEGFVQNECLPWATNGDVQAGVNKFLLRLAAKYKDPVLISDDSHFAFPKEKVVQDIRLAQHGGSWRFANSHHRMDTSEAWAYFQNVLGINRTIFDGWVNNNISWASRFKDFAFSKRNTLPVSFYPKDTYEHTLKLIQQHGRMNWENPEYVERLNKEFDLLHRNGTVDLFPYFFIDEEVCRAYAKNGLLTGPGRGSAAGLLLSYLLGITHVDPLKYKLSMDRFLTLDRIQTGKLPDIDQDLENRDFLIGPEGSEGTGWIYQRFGKCVAQISTNTTIKLKSAILDTFRARFGKVPDHIAEFTKSLPPPPQGISDADYVFGFKDTDEVWQPGLFETHAGLQEFAKNHPEEWEIIKLLLGLPRQKGRHACALVISDEPIENFIPLQTIGGVRATAFTHSQVEAAGGLKMDFLRVNSLRDISAALKLIRQRQNIELTDIDSDGIRYATVDGKKVYEVQVLPFEGKLYDIWNLPERKEVFEDICKGNVATVFQLDAGAARQGLRSFMPVNGTLPLNSIESLSAFTALDRPGPLDAYVEKDGRQVHNMLVEYANRAKGLAPIGEMPVLMQLIPETFGVIVYQEQLQAIFQSLGGTTAIEANNFRNRISKKKMVDVNRIDKPLFMKGAVAKVGQSTAEGLWAQMETFGQYGFNKSVDGTVILPYKGGFKQLQEFKGGEIVECVDERGAVVETEVVALHDHGNLEAFEIEFEDGYKTKVSANHKFLTPEGQRPLHDIVIRGLGVYSRPSIDDPASKVETPEEMSSVRLGTGQERGSCTRMEDALRGDVLQSRSHEGAPSDVPGLYRNQEEQHSDSAAESQSASRTKRSGVQSGQEHLGSPGNSASTGSETAQVANSESGENKSDMGSCTESTQIFQNGGLAEVERDTDLGGRSDSMRRDQETGRLRESGSQNLAGSRRILALLREESRKGTVSGRIIKERMFEASRCDIDSASWGVFLQFQRQTERGVESMAYSDAPLTSTGNLVLRQIVRVRSVGIRRMYDLEVAHPKHNFLMENGVVTSNSHAVCYMDIGYATAFLKHFYPLEWWTAVLSNADRKEIDEKFWRYCGHLIKLPDIQYSGPQFTIEGDSIRAPLWLMAGIGEKAHQQLMEFKKHLDTLGRKATITDLLTWIEEWRLLRGTPVTTTHKKTGQPVTKIKKAVSSLNTTILQNLIISGSLDSLFPDIDYLGMPMDVEERLKIFAFEFANINGSRKFKNLATVYNTQSKVVQFQLRKKVLPAFTDNIANAVRFDKPELFDKKTYTSEGKGWFVLDPADYERLSTMPVLPDKDILVAVVGYVTDVRIFEYSDKTDGTRKRAAELTIESNGHRITIVKWPSKARGLPSTFDSLKAGSVVSCLMSRTKGRRGFFFANADILVPPLGTPEPDEETPQ